METKVRKPKALLDAEKRIVELETKLKSETSTKDLWYKKQQEQEAVINGLHEVLDDLGIRGWKDESNKYQRLHLSVRLFSWAMKLAQGKPDHV